MRFMRRQLLLLLFTASAFAQDAGKAPFEARCAGCHGADGNGGGHGRGIAGTTRDTAAIRDVILKGIPSAGMPAFTIPAAEADAIAAYVTKLVRRPAGEAPATGDAAAGERLYSERKCAGCHMIRGNGGLLGPDLTTVGRDRTAAQIEQSLREPGAPRGGRGAPVYRAVSVKLRDGKTLRGIAKNESAFDLQLLAADGTLHLLTKDRVDSIVREPSPMPKTESASDVRQLVAYLSTLRSAGTSNAKLGDGVPFSAITRPAAGAWPTYHGSLSGNRFSPLDRIHTGNVAALAPKWMFPIPGSTRALENTPVFVDGVMYVTAANEAYALDARSGREIWRYSRPRTPGLAGDAASGINRGVAVLGDRVFMVSDNAHLFALHRYTGALIWDVEMADSKQNYGSTSAPLAVDDLIVAGVSGGDEGVRGFLDAYKASTGERAWRFWTIPAPGEPGSETWSGRGLEHGCGATWLTGTYDPEARLLYWPTGNPCPDYNGDERKGDNLYTNSVLALDPQTGKLKWHYQFTPHDLHDWDATETPVLIDTAWRGEQRKLLAHGDRNGFFYLLDRITGKVLTAEPFVKKLTWASGIGADGRPVLLPGNEPTAEGTLTCPAVAGAANWPSNAYHPKTGLFYMFAEESCEIYSKNDRWWEAGKSFYGGATRRAPGQTSEKLLKAIDLQTGKTRWEIPDIGGGILGSGLMVTAGNLIFYGDGRGAFTAANANDGKLLWHFNTGAGFKGGPMTYLLDGEQYVVTVAGSTVLAFGLPK
jgi:PQQ-dependent dehydrogenase (methanol/ethanol family)